MKELLAKAVTNRFYLRPIVIVGTGRSGTSALWRALGRHPAIFPTLAHEAPIMAQLGGFISACGLEMPRRTRYLKTNLKLPQEAVYEVMRRLCFESTVGPGYGTGYIGKLVIKSLYHRDMSLFRKHYWCAKSWFSLPSEFEGLYQLYPQIRMVCIIRNGIEVVQSRGKYPGMSHSSFSDHCKAWKEGIQIGRCLKGCSFAIEVRHEQLVAEPEWLFRRVFEFLGLKYHQAPADFIRSTLIHPLDQPTQAGVDVRQALTRRRPAYEDWSSEQRETFKALCGDAMQEAGYEVPF